MDCTPQLKKKHAVTWEWVQWNEVHDIHSKKNAWPNTWPSRYQFPLWHPNSPKQLHVFYEWRAGRMSSQNQVLVKSNDIHISLFNVSPFRSHFWAPNSHLQELLILLSEKKRSAPTDREVAGWDTSNVRPQLFCMWKSWEMRLGNRK